MWNNNITVNNGTDVFAKFAMMTPTVSAVNAEFQLPASVEAVTFQQLEGQVTFTSGDTVGPYNLGVGLYKARWDYGTSVWSFMAPFSSVAGIGTNQTANDDDWEMLTIKTGLLTTTAKVTASTSGLVFPLRLRRPVKISMGEGLFLAISNGNLSAGIVTGWINFRAKIVKTVSGG
jgi:hypothetical protein